MSIKETLDERSSNYGDFTGHAAITQGLKAVAHSHPGWTNLNPTYREAIDMILHKVGRIVNGKPDFYDSWHDIEGYARLVADRCSDSPLTVHAVAVVSTRSPLMQAAFEEATGIRPDGIANPDVNKSSRKLTMEHRANLSKAALRREARKRKKSK